MLRKGKPMDTNVRINCETRGFEEATAEVEQLAEAYDGFPAQVVIKGCHHCKINIYPSQTKLVEGRTDEAD
jgi:hypothetical protein